MAHHSAWLAVELQNQAIKTTFPVMHRTKPCFGCNSLATFTAQVLANPYNGAMQHNYLVVVIPFTLP
jgi:hypothetical protein